MILFIDGDNSYKQRIEGIEYLTERDTVNFYFNKNNSALSGGPVGNIRKILKGTLNVIKVDSASQAVDFRIAVDAARESNDNIIGVISGDNHFKTIHDSLTNDGEHDLIHYGRSVKDLLDYKLLEIDDICEYVEFVQNYYSPTAAKKLQKNIIKMSNEIKNLVNNVYGEK